ncbi:MAG: undecaprenyldiphospho-muramoylpentapeptide beta-N-acetylglucosaminyltransferase [Actinobacteria bacterium]|nr:undecaprenyldiphospho-muramoylpentapeptide beta-N-acetylglucosaminyltransferase [Actinomycetota bacterium]
MDKENRNSIKSILICGGGTAGHIYPAVAISEFIKEKYPYIRQVFVGTKRGMENKFIPELGMDFRTIKASGIINTNNYFKKILNYLKFFVFSMAGFFSSFSLIINFKPDFIIGMGGYVCGPVLAAAIFLRKNFGLHEQNYIPGRLNKIFSRFSRYIFISFEDTGKFFKPGNNKIVFTGNPVRRQIKDSIYAGQDFRNWDFQKERFTIAAFGGSLGAEKINTAVMGLYDYFKNDSNIQIILICGNRYYEEASKKLKNIRNENDRLLFRLLPYANEMNKIYTIADLIISRAGANTIAELAITNIPSILIPFPRAVDNHQFYNAEYLVKNKKAVMILDKDLNKENLAREINNLLANNKEKYFSLKEAKLRIASMDSAKIIAETIMEKDGYGK